MGRKPIIPEKTIDRMWKLHMEGKSQKHIAETLGVSAQTVSKKLKTT